MSHLVGGGKELKPNKPLSLPHLPGDWSNRERAAFLLTAQGVQVLFSYYCCQVTTFVTNWLLCNNPTLPSNNPSLQNSLIFRSSMRGVLMGKELLASSVLLNGFLTLFWTLSSPGLKGIWIKWLNITKPEAKLLMWKSRSWLMRSYTTTERLMKNNLFHLCDDFKCSGLCRWQEFKLFFSTVSNDPAFSICQVKVIFALSCDFLNVVFCCDSHWRGALLGLYHSEFTGQT